MWLAVLPGEAFLPPLDVDALFGRFAEAPAVEVVDSAVDRGLRAWVDVVDADARFLESCFNDDAFLCLADHIARNECAYVLKIVEVHCGFGSRSRAEWAIGVADAREPLSRFARLPVRGLPTQGEPHKRSFRSRFVVRESARHDGAFRHGEHGVFCQPGVEVVYQAECGRFALFETEVVEQPRLVAVRRIEIDAVVLFI